MLITYLPCKMMMVQRKLGNHGSTIVLGVQAAGYIPCIEGKKTLKSLNMYAW